MTISSLIRKVITPGDGMNTTFNFAFQVRSAADLLVYYTDAAGQQTLLASNLWSVVLNPIASGQLWSSGGNVTYPLTGAAIAAGTSLTIVRNLSLLQSSSLINQGGYFPDVVEAALDVLTMEMQQLSETISRALVLQISSSATTALPSPLANAAIGWDPTGTFITNLLTAGLIGVPVSVAQGGTGALTAATARANLGIAGLPHGQCSLAKVGANLALTPKNGNSLVVNGTGCAVPDAGVTLAPAGLQQQFATTQRTIAANVATLTHALGVILPVGMKVGVQKVGATSAGQPYNGTVTITASDATHISYACVGANEGVTADVNGLITPIYFIYATAAAGAINALEASITGHSTSTSVGNKGIEIKTGDDTRTFVGLAGIVAGAWSDGAGSRLVRSWFNRVPIRLDTTYTAVRSVNIAAYSELSFEIRQEYMMFADEMMHHDFVAPLLIAGGTGAVCALSIDGCTGGYNTKNQIFTNNAVYTVSSTLSENRDALGEGYHASTVVAAADGVNNISVGSAIYPTYGKLAGLICKGAG